MLKNGKKKKVVGYARISTEDQSNFSIANQVDKIKEFCEKNNYILVETFVDEGQSAKNFDRASWKKLDKFMSQNKKSIDYLVVYKYNRFSRNLQEALNVIHKVEEIYKIKLLSISEPIGLPPESPYFFQLRVSMLLQAHAERLMIRDNTLNGMRKAKNLGYYIHKAPYGYYNARNGQDLPIILVDEEKANIVKTIFSDFMHGYTIEQIKQKAKSLGYNQRGKSAIQRILRNKIYCGLIRTSIGDEKESYTKGIHEPLVDEDTFWFVQKLLEKPVKIKANTNDFAYLRQVVVCHVCGKPMTCSRSKGRSKYYWYYECTSSDHRKANPIEIAHNTFEAILEEITFNDDQIEYLEKAIKKNITIHIEENYKKLPTLLSKKTEFLTQKENLEKKYLLGTVDDDMFIRWKNKLDEDLKQLTSEIELLQNTESKYWNAIINKLENLLSIKDVFNQADLIQKRRFIELGFGRAMSWDGTIYRTAYVNPIFGSKVLILRRKRLLELEIKKGIIANPPLSTPGGT